MLVIAGTYERLLYGLEYKEQLEPVFMYPSHINAIKACTATKRFLATGSSDEHIKIYDVIQRKEVGTLMHHQGTITALCFFSNTHLFTASEDGQIGIVRSSDWELLKLLKGHVGSVNAMAVHPSGKILCSVGKDKTLRIWDLQRGLLVHTQPTVEPAQKVMFSKDGQFIVIVYDRKMQVYDLDQSIVVQNYSSPCRINGAAVSYLDKDLIVIGGEDRIVRVLNMNLELEKEFVSGHGNRIKDLAVIQKDVVYLATCASEGTIYLWDLKKSMENPSPIASYDCKTRITCLCLSTAEPKEKKETEKIQAPESDYDEPKRVSVSFDKVKKKRKPAKFQKNKKTLPKQTPDV
ncbi:WD40-repeat-containing domain protein [Gorgonomyces haynaldii]|nr:WD40-repeat-containing domain protein [Gorgonomyces haynaldii]